MPTSPPPEPVGAGEFHLRGRELPDESLYVPARTRRRRPLQRLFFLLLGLGCFVTALGLMREGAMGLTPALEGSIFTDNALSTLGMGWLGACIVLSGSPVAAAALTLLDGGAIDRTQAFTMLMGSRLGASFVVLVAGLVYAVRRQSVAGRTGPISIGIMALTMTALTYLPGALIGFWMLESSMFDDFNIGTSPGITSATDSLFGWAVDLAGALMPDWALFPLGVGVLLVGFSLFDRVLPHMGTEELEDRPEAWYEHKWPMFLLGCGVCLLTLSVSVSLTILVPLVASGRLRRANVLPYIAGANITTLADTLVAAILLGNQDAVRVVVAVTLAVTIWTLVLLVFFYPLIRRFCLAAATAALGSQRRLAGFVAGLLTVPIILIAI